MVHQKRSPGEVPLPSLHFLAVPACLFFFWHKEPVPHGCDELLITTAVCNFALLGWVDACKADARLASYRLAGVWVLFVVVGPRADRMNQQHLPVVGPACINLSCSASCKLKLCRTCVCL